tara:strand:+ start:140 stop:436 length:297 start_codon:yes stop_codon:yes gene_type:complete
MKFLKFSLLTLLFSFIFTFNVNAKSFEITDYTVSITGIFHDVTVAFDDLNHSDTIRCVIYKKNGGPIGMKKKYIFGVGTIEIKTAGITGTTAKCNIVN